MTFIGRFLRTFGNQGTSDGKFNYPWGLTTDSMGFIYVCDKENHRIQVNLSKTILIAKLNIDFVLQVFQSDGTFVGKFGTMGSGEGQLVSYKIYLIVICKSLKASYSY